MAEAASPAANVWARRLAEPRLLRTLFGLVLAGALARAFTSTLNHDSAWYLMATARWLEGATLYRDIVEVNPPLAFFLTAPPVWLAERLAVFPVPVFLAYLFALIALALILAGRVVAAMETASTATRIGLPLIGLVVLALLPLRDFGQREHFLMVFVWPYLPLIAARAAGSPVGPPLAAATGLFAALGVGLKPHFLLLPLFLEGALMRWRPGRVRDRFRPETLALGSGLATYAAMVPLVTPDYFGVIVPMALEVYERAYGAPFLAVLFQSKTLLIAFLALLAARLARRTCPTPNRLIDVLLLAGGALLAIYLLQGKGWSYQLYPVLATVAAALAAMLLTRATARTERQVSLSPLALAAILLTLTAEALVFRGHFNYRVMQEARPLLARHAAGGSVYVFSSNVSATYPLVLYAGVRSASRYPAQWLLPGLEQRRQPSEERLTEAARDRLAAIDRYVRDTVIEDLTRDPPALVLVDRRARKSYFGGLPFDYLDHFGDDPDFAALWRRYEPLTDISGYRVFRRKRPERAAALP